jgi:four helix bundle protein
MNQNNENSGRGTEETGFDHDRLEVTGVLLEALSLGVAMAGELPRGFGPLADQLRRALQGAYLQTSEGAARRGQDRVARLRAARAEACEAGAAVQAIAKLRFASEEKAARLVRLLARAAAMLWGLLRASGVQRG